jgi:hypothetical protein
MALTDTQLRNAKPTEKDYTITDGQGLSILISSKGAKGWRFRYRHLGKAKLMSFGTYPEVSLQQARVRRDEARALVAEGKDPGEARKEARTKAKLEALNTFEAVANEWHALHNKSKSERHQQRVKRWLEFYLYPNLGQKAVSSVTAPMVLETTHILQKQNKLETAHRVIQTAGQVFRYAIQKGFATYNPAPDLSRPFSYASAVVLPVTRGLS